MKKTAIASILAIVMALSLPACLLAGIEDPLSYYTLENAREYVGPLADGFALDLNSGLYRSAHIPDWPYASIELRAMAVIFRDRDRTFSAKPEDPASGFGEVVVPTAIGPDREVIVPTSGGDIYFPGGFDLDFFGIIVPQLRAGPILGTEALLRYFAFDTGDENLGDLSLFGLGFRHDLSQYFGPAFPIDLAGGFFWQRFKMGENTEGGDLISCSALSFGIQAGKRVGAIEPYAGLSLDSFSMKVDYVTDVTGSPEHIAFDYSTDTSAHLTLGLSLNLLFLSLSGEYDVTSQRGLSLGLAVGRF